MRGELMADNTVYIGSKPAMSYVLAVVTQFDEQDQDVVHLKARGQAISTAVDVAEFVRTRFLEEAEVDDIDIGTDRIESNEGEEMDLSSIRIDLAR